MTGSSHRDLQYASFVLLLGQHGGDFPSAYAELIEQYDDRTVTERLALNWLKELGPEAIGVEAHQAAQRFLKGGKAASITLLPAVTPEQLRGVMGQLESTALTVIAAVLTDTEGRVYSEATRARVAIKMLDIAGTAERSRPKQSTPQQAHLAAPQLSSTFGMLPDRLVLVSYVQLSESVPRLVEWLRVADPDLVQITEETVAGYLKGWQRSGVVMDHQGSVLGWDDALTTVRGQFLALPAPSTKMNPTVTMTETLDTSTLEDQ